MGRAAGSTRDLRARAGEQLATPLQAEAITARAVYRPGEGCRLPRVSPTMLQPFRALAEHPTVSPRDPHALDSFWVGCHHRMVHAALVGQRVREYLRLQAAWGRGAAGETELSRPRRTSAGVAGMSRFRAPHFSLDRAPDCVLVHNAGR